MDKKIGYIYVIVNKLNGKYYFGKTFNIISRWNKHKVNASKKINRYLYDAMNHYGYDNFSIHQIKKIECSKETITKELNKLETYFILFCNSQDLSFGYNMTKGGDGGDNLTGHPRKKEIIEKRRNSNKGKKRSKEFCEKMKIIANNVDLDKRRNMQKLAQESIKKRIKERGYTEKEIAAHKKFRDKLIEYNKSPEGRLRVSIQFKGKKKKPFSEEHRKNIGIASKGRKIPGKKISIDNLIYDSLHDAHRKLNIPLMTIRNRLINKNFPTYFYLNE
jgi:group I intron endonuclease